MLLPESGKNNSFLQGVLKHASANKYHVIVYSSENSIDVEYQNITNICSYHFDGVIWFPLREESLINKKEFEELNIPVLIANLYDSSFEYFNFEEAGKDATDYLIERHHTKIGFYYDEETEYTPLLISGYKMSLFNHEIQFSEDLIIKKDGIIEAISSKKITSLIVQIKNDVSSFKKMLEISGLIIPDDISVICIYDEGLSAADDYFTAYKIPFCQLGEKVAADIINECELKERNRNSKIKGYITENNTVLDANNAIKSKIVTVGSINIDFTLPVSSFPQPGKTISTDSIAITVGGKGANQAVGVAKLDDKSFLFGKIGNDYYSSLTFQKLKEYNVDSSCVLKDQRKETGKAYIHVTSSGESSITLLSGANYAITEEELESKSEIFDGAKYCLLQTEIPVNLVIKAAKIAKEHSVTTLLKPSSCNYVDENLLENIDYFIPNIKEAKLLCPSGIQKEKNMAEYFISKGAGNVIITLGAGGVFIYDKENSIKLPAIKSFKPVDTTGGSDAFISAFAVYLDKGYDIVTAAKIAQYAAGFCISRAGVISALVDRQTLETYIFKEEPELLKRY